MKEKKKRAFFFLFQTKIFILLFLNTKKPKTNILSLRKREKGVNF